MLLQNKDRQRTVTCTQPLQTEPPERPPCPAEASTSGSPDRFPRMRMPDISFVSSSQKVEKVVRRSGHRSHRTAHQRHCPPGGCQATARPAVSLRFSPRRAVQAPRCQRLSAHQRRPQAAQSRPHAAVDHCYTRSSPGRRLLPPAVSPAPPGASGASNRPPNPCTAAPHARAAAGRGRCGPGHTAACGPRGTEPPTPARVAERTRAVPSSRPTAIRSAIA